MPREAVPPYRRVAAVIRERIETGQLLPGEQVPSMAALSEEFAISRGTARRVLTTLRDEGLITITPGWGSFVAER